MSWHLESFEAAPSPPYLPNRSRRRRRLKGHSFFSCACFRLLLFMFTLRRAKATRQLLCLCWDLSSCRRRLSRAHPGSYTWRSFGSSMNFNKCSIGKCVGFWLWSLSSRFRKHQPQLAIMGVVSLGSVRFLVHHKGWNA